MVSSLYTKKEESSNLSQSFFKLSNKLVNDKLKVHLQCKLAVSLCTGSGRMLVDLSEKYLAHFKKKNNCEKGMEQQYSGEK